MTVLRYYITIVLFFLTNFIYGQTGYYVAKDYRIAKHEDSIINFLINKQQFDINETPFKTSDYEGKIYVRKHLELFNDSSKCVLLAQFGSLGGSHKVYWALFTSEQFFFFRKIYDVAFKRFTKQYDSRVVAVITTYIKLPQPDIGRKKREIPIVPLPMKKRAMLQKCLYELNPPG